MQQSNCKNVELLLRPSQIASVLAGLVLLASTGHIVVHLLSYFFDITETPFIGVWLFFTMNDEANLPTYLSSLNLLVAGILCAIIASRQSALKQFDRVAWWGLAAGLALMSLDEAAQIHEGVVGQIISGYFGSGEGVLYYRWYLAYIPLVAILAFLYIPFIKRLPLRYSFRFVLAAVVFLSGALGVEFLESYLASIKSTIAFDTLVAITTLVEETLEMSGIAIFIYSLSLYMAEFEYSFNFLITADIADPRQSRYNQNRVSAKQSYVDTLSKRYDEDK